MHIRVEKADPSQIELKGGNADEDSSNKVNSDTVENNNNNDNKNNEIQIQIKGILLALIL